MQNEKENKMYFLDAKKYSLQPLSTANQLLTEFIFISKIFYNPPKKLVRFINFYIEISIFVQIVLSFTQN